MTRHAAIFWDAARLFIKNKSSSLFFLITALLAALRSPVYAQYPAPAPSPTPLLTTKSTLVLIPALVRTKAGSLVYSLSAEDFLLTDDGVPQKLLLEQDTGGEPLALVVVVETGGAGAREMSKLSALAPMIESVIGDVPHKVAVVAFDSEPALVQGFTGDMEATRSTLHDLTEPGGEDNGAAILDSVGFAVNLLRKQPPQYRRAVLLISETLDRGSHIKLDDALRSVSDTNTAIYSIGFSTGRSEAAHYGSRELPRHQPGGSWLAGENPHPNPPTGCMGKDPNPDPDATHNKAVQAYDCLTQLLPPLGLAKMAAIAATDGLRKNIPETVARLTGGEYFKLTDEKSLQRDLATISNHIPNRYVLSFQPRSPHPGLHAIELRLQDHPDFEVMARSTYWADDGAAVSSQPSTSP